VPQAAEPDGRCKQDGGYTLSTEKKVSSARSLKGTLAAFASRLGASLYELRPHKSPAQDGGTQGQNSPDFFFALHN